LTIGKAWQSATEPLKLPFMAANLIKRASDALRKENLKITKRKAAEKLDIDRTMTTGGAFAGAFGAALIDKKWGEDPEGDPVLVEPAKVKGIPVNLALGAAGTLGSLFWKGMPMRSVVGGAFLGQGCAGIYRLAYDNIDFDKPAE
jgi:hypothetical protein